MKHILPILLITLMPVVAEAQNCNMPYSNCGMNNFLQGVQQQQEQQVERNQQQEQERQQQFYEQQQLDIQRQQLEQLQRLNNS